MLVYSLRIGVIVPLSKTLHIAIDATITICSGTNAIVALMLQKKMYS
jgi:hypothetical protein